MNACTLCALGDEPGCEACRAVEPVGEPAPSIVYRIRHVPTGRIYVGVHRIDGDPYRDDGYQGSGKHLERAIDYHGWSEFRKDVLAVLPTTEAALGLEAGLVGPEQVASRWYFNLCEGGRAPVGLSEESQEKKREGNRAAARAKFDTDPVYRAKVAEAARATVRRRSETDDWYEATTEAAGRPEVREKKRANAKTQWASMSDEERAAFVEKATASLRTPEGKAARSEVSKRTWERLSEEQRAAQRSYWAAMTSKERSAEMRRRHSVARENKRVKREVGMVFLALVAAKYGDA